MSQTIPVIPGNHSMLKHCIDVDCVSYVYFDYILLEDGDECSSNPCQNGGTCVDVIASYSCNCLLQYTGSHCEQRLWCAPNPCQNGGMCIEGNDTFLCNCSEQYTGNTCEQKKWCFLHPCQNGGMCSEGPHSSRCTCPPQYTGTHCEHRNYCYPNPCRNGGTCLNGLSSFRCRCNPRYTGTRCDRWNYCYPNHCRNGGTCNNGLHSYTCSCPSTHIGTCCDYRVGWFQVYAHYGRRLSDQDGWWAGYSDPYLKVIVYDYLGFSVQRLTRYISENQNPDWNQRLYFTYRRAWSRFTVRVWDSDNNADDALSHPQTFSITSPGCRNSVRHNAYGGGYVIFDY